MTGMDENPYQSPAAPPPPPRARPDGDAPPITLWTLFTGILIVTSSMTASLGVIVVAEILMSIFR